MNEKRTITFALSTDAADFLEWQAESLLANDAYTGRRAMLLDADDAAEKARREEAFTALLGALEAAKAN